MANLRTDLTDLGGALARGNATEVRRLGHAIKGAGLGYGFTVIGELGAAIERHGAAGELDEANVWVQRLAVYAERVRVEFVDDAP